MMFSLDPIVMVLPWKPVLITASLGIVSFAVFFWRTILVVKSRMYQGDQSERMKNQIKQTMDISRTQTAISVVEEDLKLSQVKLRASMSTECNLKDQIKKLEDDRSSLEAAKAGLEDECSTLREKVEVLNELYQQKEMALQKKLSKEEFERQEKEQRLSVADEKVVLAAEELKTYKQRIEEMEDELQKTERSFKNQLAVHEKRAHDNWLKARAAERAIAEEKRESSNLRHKLLEMTQKMAMLQEEPVIVKPMPGRPNMQNAPRRGSMDGPLPRPRWSSEASGKPSAPDAGSGAAPTMNSRLEKLFPCQGDGGGQGEYGYKRAPLFPRGALHGLPCGRPSSTAHSLWTTAPLSTLRASTAHQYGLPPQLSGPPPPPTQYGPPPQLSEPPLPNQYGLPPQLSGPPPPIQYGPPPQLCGPFGPRPLGPQFGPGPCPPLGIREYAPGVPPGKGDLPVDPREFLPGHAPFTPPGNFVPREYFIPGARLPPPPTHGPQDYPPSAARDLPPSGSRDEPLSDSQSSGQGLLIGLKKHSP
nr:transport and Golgi organization protein 1 homolog [Equus asinus]